MSFGIMATVQSSWNKRKVLLCFGKSKHGRKAKGLDLADRNRRGRSLACRYPKRSGRFASLQDAIQRRAQVKNRPRTRSERAARILERRTRRLRARVECLSSPGTVAASAPSRYHSRGISKWRSCRCGRFPRSGGRFLCHVALAEVELSAGSRGCLRISRAD